MSFDLSYKQTEVGRAYPMVVVSILLHAEFGINDHREDATTLQPSHSCIAIDDKGVCLSAQQMLSMSTTNVMCFGY